MTQLAFIGIGNIGRAMTKNLVEKGNLSKPLILYNRTTSRAQAHSESLGTDKTSVASTIADAVGPSDIIFSCLGDDKAVKAVIDEALQSNVEGKLFVECSTIEPATANALAKAVEAKGAGWISMPIFGAPPAALAGQLVTVPAGKAELIEKIRPYTTGVVARASIKFPEEEPGKALLLKITGNSIIMMMVEAIAQAHTMAEKIGLPSEKLHNFFESMFPGPYVAYSNRMLQGDYYKKDPMFMARLAIKDCNLMTSLTEEAGGKLPGIELVRSQLQTVDKSMGDAGDIAGVYGVLREQSGLPFQK